MSDDQDAGGYPNLQRAALYRMLANCFRELAAKYHKESETCGGRERHRYERAGEDWERSATRLESEANYWGKLTLKE